MLRESAEWRQHFDQVAAAGVTPDMLKHLKEEFVTGYSGSGLLEVTAVAAVLPAAVICARAVLTRLNAAQLPAPARTGLEFCLLVLPTIVAFSVTQWTWAMLAAFLIITLLVGGRYLQWNSPQAGSVLLKRSAAHQSLPFITYYRSSMLIATAVAILAVDFTIFPRKFCKCEMYGTSLMDAGVGSFVLAGGMVSRVARHAEHRSSPLATIWGAISAASPMLILGSLRFVTIKLLKYQEHVTEYGVHWNFFGSLAAVAIVAAVVDVLVSLVSSKASSWIYVMIAASMVCGYQYGLSNGLTEYILHAARTDLFSQNREGILGVLGFSALYLCGVVIGRVVQQRRDTIQQWKRLVVQLALAAIVCWVALWASETWVEPVSRRLTNLSYVLWILAYNLTQLLPLVAADVLWSAATPFSSLILEAANKNGLAYFMLANLSTGLVNISTVTLFIQPALAFVIVSLYMLWVSSVSVAWLQRGWKLKFW